ncbi:antibiotic biosynthesis monooxygenase [Cerasicoccus arenae]|uniref:Antibiotic biosynthesis monooxygenase n=1 Tax=Cerasicoccus arenae TaxID=424488 RepID=A0A8J3GF94_9BACT|nr:antibiotic biosynthesis monooxygenase [Cerasicoccus arenae]MBK1857913.1 hypothetical protein [Cerasicoccus arenae]GHC09602.1 antibiotic biosynthesis monooxygenase [Cerasicoccus arenae]
MTAPQTAQPATVIISQVVPEDKWAEFEEMQHELNLRVQHFAGFIGTEVLKPKKGVQEEWVVIFRFDNPENLQDWLASRQRTQLINELLPEGCEQARMQIIAEAPRAQHVTAVFSHRIKAGKEDSYRAWRVKILEAQKQFQGFVGQESFDPVEGLTQEWVDIARFQSTEAVDEWLKSPLRVKLLEELQPMLDELAIRRVGTGLDGWFRVSSESPLVEAPPAWKQAVSVLFALYPTVMLLSLYFNPLFGKSTPFALVMLFGNAVSVALLTWVIMPFVNRLLGWWLLPKKKSAALDIGGAIGIMLTLIAMYFLFNAIG